MDTTMLLAPFVEKLRKVNDEMLKLHSRLAREKNWDEAERVFAWARSLHQLIGQMASPSAPGRTAGPQRASPPLPYFYIDRDEKVVMRARSRNGGFYEHRVVKPHYDLIIQKVASFARTGSVFYSRDLQNREEMPVHEPLLVMRLLVNKGLLTKLGKGRFAFEDPRRFVSAAAQLWSQLPRESSR